MAKLTGWLKRFRDTLAKGIAAIAAMDGQMVEIDIERRKRDRAIGKRYADNRLKLMEELDKIGMSEAEFCGKLGNGNSLDRMRRRMRLVPDKAWANYLRLRREQADAVFTLEYAVYLAESGTKRRPPPSLSGPETAPAIDTDHEFIHSHALPALQQRLAKSIHVAVTSPPYWPCRRLYVPDDPHQMGMEPTWEEYITNQMEVFNELKRVLRDDGVCWVLLDDVTSQKPYRYSTNTYNHGKTLDKWVQQTDITTQDTTYLAPTGDFLGLPFRFAQAMQTNGWHWRDFIIWCKGASGRRESTRSRCRHNFEFVLMFTKSMNYCYDADALRIPLAGGQPYTIGSAHSDGWRAHGKPRKDGLRKGYTTPGRHKPGWSPRDPDRDFRAFSNPLGRLMDAVWTIPPKGWRGAEPLQRRARGTS